MSSETYLRGAVDALESMDVDSSVKTAAYTELEKLARGSGGGRSRYMLDVDLDTPEGRQRYRDKLDRDLALGTGLGIGTGGVAGLAMGATHGGKAALGLGAFGALGLGGLAAGLGSYRRWDDAELLGLNETLEADRKALALRELEKSSAWRNPWAPEVEGVSDELAQSLGYENPQALSGVEVGDVISRAGDALEQQKSLYADKLEEERASQGDAVLRQQVPGYLGGALGIGAGGALGGFGGRIGAEVGLQTGRSGWVTPSGKLFAKGKGLIGLGALAGAYLGGKAGYGAGANILD